MRLLNKTIISYFLFTALLATLSVPVFYYVLKTMVVKRVDEDLVAIKTRIMPRLRDEAAKHNQGSFDLYDHFVIFERERTFPAGDSISDSGFGKDTAWDGLPGRQLVSHFILNQESYRLQIRTSMVDKFSLLKRIVILLIILLIALLLGLLTINRILAKKIWKPFYKTLRDLQDYRVDKQQGLKLEQSSIREFDDLNRAIEGLAKRDYQSYNSQKEFAENASHEMQSPLAVFQSKLELLMQTKPLNEEQASLIADLANASKRMSRLNKSLILLTRIENNQFLEKEEISIREIIQKLLLQYDFQIRQKSIQCQFPDPGDILLNANRTVSEILLGNLLSNAIRHNREDGIVQIMIKDRELMIRNTGRPLPLREDRLFQRFWKESPDSGSIGLGLELVKKICTLNHYILRYEFVLNMHQFTIGF